jgi:hypothetical protein
MAEILRYVHVDLNDNEGDYEYDTLQEAIDAADEGEAIICRTYTYDDSELVWTPNGGSTWPPEDNPREKGDDDGQEYADPRDEMERRMGYDE